MKRIVMFILAVFVLTFCKPIDKETENEKLLQTDREFATLSIESGAAEAFNQYLTDNALQLPARRNPIQGRNNIYDNMKENQDNYTLNWSPQFAEVALSGELGYTWGTYTLTYIDETGEEQQSYGKYLNIWKKQINGDWKVAVDMGNESPEPL